MGAAPISGRLHDVLGDHRNGRQANACLAVEEMKPPRLHRETHFVLKGNLHRQRHRQRQNPHMAMNEPFGTQILDIVDAQGKGLGAGFGQAHIFRPHPDRHRA